MAKPKHGSDRVPSPALLSALALIAAAPTVVAGGPLPLPTQPPDFLCPFIRRDVAPPPPSPQCSVVADKFVQGTDSLWRKTDTWTLYGSTCYSSSTASTSASQSQQSASRPPMSTSTPSPVEFDTSVLPVGWDNATTFSSTTESTIILALAIALAGSICVFMIGCVIWRRRKKRSRDIERKLSHRRSVHNDPQDNGREKDVRGTMRMWARATARWKSNIRQSARRRRKRHPASASVHRPPSPTVSDSPPVSLVAPSVLSRRGSIVPAESDPSNTEPVACLNGNVSDPPALLHDSPRSASPPTYGASFVSRFSRPSSSAVPNPPSPSNQPSFIDDEPLPYVPPSDGHIAVDDKAQLAHIRQLASSPPMPVHITSAHTVQAVSAPEWHEVEDDLDDLGIDSGQVPTSSCDFSLPPSFPPLPSKADVPHYLDDHPLHYGEGDTPASLLVPASSRFSLGALPSAPPIDDLNLEPSAPTLEGDDDLFQDWDQASSYIPEVPTLADLSPTPTCAIESPTSSTVSSPSPVSFPCMLEPATRDGVLPRYHP